MKKIFSITLLLLALVIFIPNVFAANKIQIESVSLVEKSNDVLELSSPTINGDAIDFDLSFVNVGDTAKYKVIITNNSNKEYYVDNENKFKDKDYISYLYEFEGDYSVVKPNSKLTMYITIKYNKKVSDTLFKNGIYTDENDMSVELSDVILSNPETFSNIIALIIIFLILSLVIIIKNYKDQKVILSLLILGLLIIPFSSFALERYTIKATAKVMIEKGRNMIEPRYTYVESEGGYIDNDFWDYDWYIDTVTFENHIYVPDGYDPNRDLKYDVSVKKDNGVIAYLIENENGNYDLYIMSDGYVYANFDSSNFFYDFRVNKINNIENFNTIYATDMSSMFAYTRNITELDLSSFNTSNVTNMEGMFYAPFIRYGSGGCMSGCVEGSGNSPSVLEKIILDNWDTSKVTNMSYMFANNGALKELDLSSFDTSNVTNMSYMFQECMKLTNLDLKNFNVSKVTDFTSMFYYSYNLKNIDIEGWVTSSATNMSHMFDECSNLEYVNLSKFDTKNVIDMSYMFNLDGKLKDLDLSNFDTSNVTNFDHFLYACSSLTEVDLSGFNTINVTNMEDMFGFCKGIVSLDLSSFNVSNVTNMTFMFNFCQNLEHIYVGSSWNANNVVDSSEMFRECVKLPNFNERITDKRAANTSSTGYLTLK